MRRVQNNKKVLDIRFPGFEGEWEFSKAGFLFKNSVSKGFEGLPIYSVTQADGMVERSSLDREFDDISDPEGNRFVKKDDIAYNMMRMWQGAVGVAPVDCMISPAYVVLSPNSDVSSQFYYKIFKSKKYLYLLTSYSQGLTSDRLRLYYKEFAQMNLPHPVLEEQQKIASFLSDVDTKIEKLVLKKELLEQYKKGVMQKLFSQELRFKIKNEAGELFEPPEWEEKKLGEIFTERSSRGDDSYKLLSVTIRDGIISRSDIESKDNSSANKSNYKIVKAGDIVYNSMRMWQGANGLAYTEGIVSPAYTVITPLKIAYAPFFAYLFKWKPMIFMFQRHSQGLTSDTWNCKFPAFSKIVVVLPTKNEQQKIADLLSDIDAKINQIDKEISAVKEFKKGLLQGMFV